MIKSAASAASAKGGCASSRLDHSLKFHVIQGGCASSRLISGFSDCGQTGLISAKQSKLPQYHQGEAQRDTQKHLMILERAPFEGMSTTQQRWLKLVMLFWESVKTGTRTVNHCAAIELRLCAALLVHNASVQEAFCY